MGTGMEHCGKTVGLSQLKQFQTLVWLQSLEPRNHFSSEINAAVLPQRLANMLCHEQVFVAVYFIGLFFK